MSKPAMTVAAEKNPPVKLPNELTITPAFSPGPWMTHGALVGSFFSHTFEDL